MIDNKLLFKKAESKDVDLLFGWINEAEVRAQSLSNHNISYPEHYDWFIKKLADKNCYLYIVYKDKEPAGMIRFDVKEDECTISYLVDKLQRGKGIGAAIISYGMEEFKKKSNFSGWLIATVKNANEASLKIFTTAGFEKELTDFNLIRFKKLIHNANSL